MTSRWHDQIVRTIALAGRVDGVSNKELQLDLGCSVKVAAVLLWRAGQQAELVRARAPRGRLRSFTTTQAARTWLEKQLACLRAAERALARTKSARAAAAKEAAALQAQQRAQAKEQVATQRATAKRLAQEQRTALRQAKRDEAAAAAAQAKAQRCKALPSTKRASAGLFDSGPRVRAPLPLTAAQAFALATPVVTPNTKHTVRQITPESHRVNRMADPLPTVPGWATGPAIRPGALDFKRYQHHGPLAPLTGKGGAA